MNKKLKTTALLLGVCSSLFFANASVSAICKDIDCYHKENPVTQGTGGCTGDGCINVGGKGGKGETLSGLYYQGELSGKKLEIKIGNELAGGKGNSTPNPDCKNAGKEGLGGNGGDGVGLYIDGKPIAVAAGGGGGNGGKKEKSENINGTNANSDMQNKTIGKQGENGINIGAGGGGGGEYGGKAGTGGYTSTVTDKSCTSMDGTNNCIVKGKLADELINQLSDEDKEKIKNSSSYAIVQVIKDSSASL